MATRFFTDATSSGGPGCAAWWAWVTDATAAEAATRVMTGARRRVVTARR
jgi:hypothetical protein